MDMIKRIQKQLLSTTSDHATVSKEEEGRAMMMMRTSS
jgi:hypothetical protein